MTISSLASATNSMLQAYGRTAQLLLGSYRANGIGMLRQFGEGVERIVEQRQARLPYAKELISAQQEIFDLAANGFSLMTRQQTAALQAMVNAATVGVRRMSARAERLEGAVGPTPLSSLILVAQPLAEIGKEVAEQLVDRVDRVVSSIEHELGNERREAAHEAFAVRD